MATKTIKGGALRLNLGGKVVLHSTSSSLSMSREFSEISSKDTEGKEYFPEDMVWSISCEQFVSVDDENTKLGTDVLMDHFLAGDKLEVDFTTGETGDFMLSGAVYIETCDITAANLERATGSFAFKGAGTIVKTTVA